MKKEYEHKQNDDLDEKISKNKPVIVCIVIPTYNEIHNIVRLLTLIYSKERQARYSEENINLNVLVVDDNSPDGTAKAVKEYQKSNHHVYILEHEKKNGLGKAYIAGMQHSMKILNPDIIFEMDGDLSHGPEYILPMIHEIEKGADFVIGSRYIKGGSIPQDWGVMRKLISRSANFYAKTVLGIKDVHDCTGGFRAIRTSALRKVDFCSLKVKGYAFQITLLEEMRRNNEIIKETPIAFKDRTHGESKMSIHDIIEEILFIFNTRIENTFFPKKRNLEDLQNQECWLDSEGKNDESTKIQKNIPNSSFHQSYQLKGEPLKAESSTGQESSNDSLKLGM